MAFACALASAVLVCFAARAEKTALPPDPVQNRDPAAIDEQPPDGLDVQDDERAVESAVAEMHGAPDQPAQVQAVPATTPNAVVERTKHPDGLKLWRKSKLTGKGDDRGYYADLPNGKRARLSVEPALQERMQKLFTMYKPLQGALVALDPKTGKVLALVEFDKEGKPDGLATKALYPAASVFKIITGAALLEKGISPDEETCFHGGVRGIVGKLLEDKPHMDRRCLSLSMALARSANVVFAKMAVKHLDGESLRKEAERFLFNRPTWDPGIEQSVAQIPDGKLELAKSAAGFGQVKLSPMHAALIAAAVGNSGVAVEPTIVEEIGGERVAPSESTRLLQPETAAALREMMKYTVTSGTATSSFRERGHAVLGEIEVAGKTGSLSNHQRPYKDYSWFVGFAPAQEPKIAVAAVVVNGLKWSIHAPYVAREAFRAYLVGGSLGQPPVARVHRRARHRRH